MPGTVLGSGNMAINETGQKILVPVEFYILVRTDNKEM